MKEIGNDFSLISEMKIPDKQAKRKHQKQFPYCNSIKHAIEV
jgi:hypothetical protein